MTVKIAVREPDFRLSPRRWFSAVCVSLSTLIIIVGFAKLFLSAAVLHDDGLRELLYESETSPNVLLADSNVADPNIEDGKHIGKRQGPSKFIVTGINWNGVQQRQNFLTFAADADLLNLFLCGLENMQNMDQNTRESFFQIAGIHGAPYTSWDGEDGPNTGSGYCTHASILFPTWHRPYLAAYEQILGNIMRNLANQYPAGNTRSRYQAAANRFRLPYWDWASNAQVPDIIGSQPQVTVEKPQGFVRINNPLFTYSFHPFSSSIFPYPPFNSWTRTLRQPDGNGNTQPNVVNQQLGANQASIFSNKAWNNGGSGNQDSIESVHDLIHGVVGGAGHMAVVDTSAHDPVFMLHHCNVDRLTAMWQTLNPNSYTVGQTASFATRTTSPGFVEDANSNLVPFHQSQDSYWTSNKAKDTRSFFYTYPELADAGTVPAYRLRSRLRVRIENLYGANAPQNQLRTNEKRSLEGRANTPQLVKDGKYHEWTTNVRLNKYVAGGPYLINFYVGEPTEGVEWTDDPNFAGSYYLFSKNGTCMGCPPESVVTGSVPLTDILIQCAKNGHIQDLTPESVIPYLRNRIQWRIQLPSGGSLDASDIQSLKVSVSAAEVTLPTSDSNSGDITDWTTYYDVTNKKPGGLCYGDPE
ncbi:Tyrosinase [Drechslerella dactyloides]|uniref:tyrosinase n=1 Tax=Drechslerella dactyloides TaxID=74499 RepID=A0AAD6NK31_DREDA|nr:Tyrosinase [Drechslerella dactyloides]